MDDLVTGLVVGAAVAFLLMGLVMVLVVRRHKARHIEEVRRYDASIVDLRQERAEDKETNRRLRHELVSQSPERLLETAHAAELERAGAVSERDQAVEQLLLVQQDLSLANGRLADREAKLRQYREALKEIRISLEAQDRGRSAMAADGLIDTDTGELPAGALGGVAAQPAAIDQGGIDSRRVGSSGVNSSALSASALDRSSLDGRGLDQAEIETADASAVD